MSPVGGSNSAAAGIYECPEPAEMNPRFIWAGFYLAVNAVALLYSLSTGELLGDGSGFSVSEPGRLYLAFFLIAASIVALYVIFELLCRVRVAIHETPLDGYATDLAFGTLIVLFVAYVQLTGLFVAGSAERGGTVLSAFFVLFNIDLLFLIYYAACRHHSGFAFVAAVWLVSVVQRGWFGYIFLLVALESVRIIRQGRVKPLWVLMLLLLVPTFPVLDAVKVFIRLNPGMQVEDLLAIVPGLVAEVEIDLVQVVPVLVEKIVGRLQVLTHAYLVIDNQSVFLAEVENGGVMAFWREGLFGVFYDRVFAIERLPESSQLLATFIVPETESAWNVNPSLVGWLFIYGDALPFALVYVLLLCATSFVLMKKISNTTHARDALWFYWLVLLVPGWISQFASFVGTMLLFLFVAASARALGELLARGAVSHLKHS